MNRTARQIFFLLPAAVMLLFPACTKTAAPYGNGIGFSAGSQEVKSTGSQLTDNSNLTGSDIGVFGYYSSEDGGSAVTNVFETTEAVRLSYRTGKWTYSPVANWHRSQYYRFRAFHPYEANLVSGSDADNLIIDYKPSVDKYDLLLAFSERYPAVEGTGPVKLTFRHALSALCFRIAFDPSVGEQDPTHSDVIKKFWLTGLYGAGTMYYTDKNGTNEEGEIIWDKAGYEANESFYLWESEDGKEFGITDADKSSNICTIFDGDGIVFAIPQTCSDPIDGLTRINFVTGNAPDVVQSFELPLHEWEPGKKYTYDILITLSDVNITVSVTDWTDREAQLDIFA